MEEFQNQKYISIYFTSLCTKQLITEYRNNDVNLESICSCWIIKRFQQIWIFLKNHYASKSEKSITQYCTIRARKIPSFQSWKVKGFRSCEHHQKWWRPCPAKGSQPCLGWWLSIKASSWPALSMTGIGADFAIAEFLPLGKWLGIACRWEVENKFYFFLLACACATFHFCSSKLPFLTYDSFSILFSPPVTRRRGSDRVAWWTSGIQKKTNPSHLAREQMLESYSSGFPESKLLKHSLVFLSLEWLQLDSPSKMFLHQ